MKISHICVSLWLNVSFQSTFIFLWLQIKRILPDLKTFVGCLELDCVDSIFHIRESDRLQGIAS